MTTVQGTGLSLVSKFADKYSVDPNKLMTTLKQTAFKQPKEGAEVSDAQMMALLVVADQYSLNPFTKEIYAFPDKFGGIVPVVSVDGWLRIINSHPAFDGMEFVDEVHDGKLQSITCQIYRKDRSRPISVTEYMDECKRGTDPWNKWPARMLRHKAVIQAGRYAFGFAGIHDQDEAERIMERDITSQTEITRRPKQAEPRESQTVIIDGNRVNTETGEVVEGAPPTESDPHDESADMFAVKGSPAFTGLVKQLMNTQTEQDVRILTKAALLTKCSATERKDFLKMADERVNAIQAGMLQATE